MGRWRLAWRRPLARAGLPLVLLLLLAAGLAGRSAAQSPDEPPVPPGVGERPAATIVMTNELRYDPESITINQGDSVLWRNQSRVGHTVTDDPDHRIAGVDYVLPAGAQPFDSGEIGPGVEYAHRFDVPGVYRYACVFHGVGGMVGTINVKPRP